MKRGWFILLVVSLGLNAGLLYTQFWGRPGSEESGAPEVPIAGESQGVGPVNHPEGYRGFIRDRLNRIGARVNLGEGQRGRMSATMNEMMPQILAQRDIVQETQEAIREEYLKPEIDRDRVLDLQRQSSVAQARLDSLVTEEMLKETEVLSPKQREGYFELMRWRHQGQHGARMRRGRGRAGR
jgi:Spy/CpxP family protein refolding chaperone